MGYVHNGEHGGYPAVGLRYTTVRKVYPRNVKKVQDIRDMTVTIGDIPRVVPLAIRSLLLLVLRAGATLRILPYQLSHL